MHRRRGGLIMGLTDHGMTGPTQSDREVTASAKRPDHQGVHPCSGNSVPMSSGIATSSSHPENAAR